MCDVWRGRWLRWQEQVTITSSASRTHSKQSLSQQTFISAKHLTLPSVPPGSWIPECGQFLSPGSVWGIFGAFEIIVTRHLAILLESRVKLVKQNTILVVSRVHVKLNGVSITRTQVTITPRLCFITHGSSISNFQDLTIYFTLSFTYLVSEHI